MSRQDVENREGGIDEISMVTTYCRNVMGEHLRLVASADAESVEMEWVRDDLRESIGAEDVAEWIDPLLADAENAAAQEWRVGAGAHRSTLHVFDGMLLFHYPRDSGRSLVVSVDPSWIEDVIDHVATCQQLMQ
ncbi:MAG: hypothetical protein ABEJ27_02570 [Halodesulfurarchaeum sp.]